MFIVHHSVFTHPMVCYKFWHSISSEETNFSDKTFWLYVTVTSTIEIIWSFREEIQPSNMKGIFSTHCNCRYSAPTTYNFADTVLSAQFWIRSSLRVYLLISTYLADDRVTFRKPVVFIRLKATETKFVAFFLSCFLRNSPWKQGLITDILPYYHSWKTQSRTIEVLSLGIMSKCCISHFNTGTAEPGGCRSPLFFQMWCWNNYVLKHLWWNFPEKHTKCYIFISSLPRSKFRFAVPVTANVSY